MVGLISRPLFLWLKWTYKHIYPTGMGDCDSDADHHGGAVAAEDHADEVDAEDAAGRAADKIDSGEI